MGRIRELDGMAQDFQPVAITVRIKGGPGSGHHGHRGRPGKVGGSLPGKGVLSLGTVSAETRADWRRSGLEINDPAHAHLNEGLGSMYSAQGTSVDINWETVTYNKRMEVKDEIVTKISDETGVEYGKVNTMIGQWARTSNNESFSSLAMQNVAAEEFGADLSEWQEQKWEEQAEYAAEYASWYDNETDIHIFLEEDSMRKVMRSMYNHTQEKLREAGYEEDDYIVLHRGVTAAAIPGALDYLMGRSKVLIKQGDVVQYFGNAMESWSLAEHVASRFGHVVISAKVPIRNILCTARTGFGCLSEGEFVILNSDNEQSYVNWVGLAIFGSILEAD